jgi:hypothetical protein
MVPADLEQGKITEFSYFGDESSSSVSPSDVQIKFKTFNPLNAELNPICHLLALVGAHHILHVSRVRVNKNLGKVPKT